MHARKMVQKGFTLVEILIVVVILGILAAIVIPQFTNASESAKASSLASQLQSIRSQVELYKNQHNGNEPDLTANWDQFTMYTDIDGNTSATKDSTFTYGPYMQKPAVNPFEDSSTVEGDPETEGTAAAGTGWAWRGGTLKAVIETVKGEELGLLDTADGGENSDFVGY